jgi:two-component system phosphate regulon sensor histidine kinase PhoR
MNKFRVRLTVIFLSLIGLSVLASGLFTGHMMKNAYIQSLQENMKRELGIIIASSEWINAGSEEEQLRFFSDKVRRIGALTGARLTYIREDGKVLGDTEHDPATMDNHLSREEIVEARKSGYGHSIRYSDTLGQNMLYVAIPVQMGVHEVGYMRLAMSLERVDASIRTLWYWLLLGLLVLFALAGFAAYRIARALTSPIEKITRVAQQITDTNYRSRVTLRNKDEIGQLGHAINAMADSLQQQVERISENENRLKSVLDGMMSGILMIDREERIVLMNRAAEEYLGFASEELLGKPYTLANQQFEFTDIIRECMETHEHVRDEVVFYFPEERILEVSVNPMSGTDDQWAGVLVVLHNITAVRRLERMRSEFVANVSHELKTPVAAVKGFAETLLAGALNDKDTARTFLQIIYDESERLNRLIGDILELSKIESKRIPLQFSPVYLNDFAATTMHMVAAEAERKHISMEMDVGEELVLEADEDRLRQIVLNLLSNAISYTPEGGRVRVLAEALPADAEHDDRVRLMIADTGIGIPKNDVPRIFERFYRVDKARSRSSGGTGLGLSIVKHLVDLHKGTIAVESEVGTGTRFIIDLPVLHD